jgi:hypothetical protein
MGCNAQAVEHLNTAVQDLKNYFKTSYMIQIKYKRM